uniref:Protein kinase domain-containing protein n=1 Tax=Globisporangium ultimum (strain ATCC 200006 / CBS 805.95 / DAOM BR144) TaxID=431595 RepID=K3W881_GLOUD
MFSRLVTRLEDVSAMQDGLESHLLTLVTITFRLCSFLLKYKSSKKDHPLSRFIASRVIASKVRDFHEELDHFIDFSGTKRDVGPHVTWQEQWREDRLDQQGTFQDLLRDDSVLTQGLADSEQRVEIEEEEEERKMQHTDILFQLQYELRTCETEGDTDMCTQIQDFMDRLVGLVNLNLPVVPEWFVSSDDVDFHERNLVDDSFTKQYHGTWKKASVMVVLLDPKKYDFEVRATKWFSLRHPNIVALYGACHVTNPPFLVYEYVPDEISLEDFLKVGSNRHLVWEKLYEAALALNYLHQNRVAHGRLGDKNIVISRNGQVKVGNLEVDGSYYWGPPEQFRQNVTESPASNIFSFGICILKVTSDGWRFYDTAKTFLDGRIPERVPNLNGEQWDLVVQMCAYEPHDRVDIAYVVNQLKIFAMKYGNTNRAPDYEANAGCAV